MEIKIKLASIDDAKKLVSFARSLNETLKMDNGIVVLYKGSEFGELSIAMDPCYKSICYEFLTQMARIFYTNPDDKPEFA